MNRQFWRNKRVFITGHTGFKGSWLTLWLHDLGAKIFGYSLQPPTTPNHFDIAQIEDLLSESFIGDIRDFDTLMSAIKTAQPEIVIHMAAQPLVRHSYANPVETYSINVIGTINVFEAVRIASGVKAIINITSDKCYYNHEWLWGYRENDTLGGHDPYSGSKACSELLTDTWRQSYFNDSHIALASARAGNVIGGGDWALDRLLPDVFRALESKQSLCTRSPESIRPWQHVLEPLNGYMMLAEQLFQNGKQYAEAWNFGPNAEDCRSVEWVLKTLSDLQPEFEWKTTTRDQHHEARLLQLDCSKSHSRLNWKPSWRIKTALQKTLEWHTAWQQGQDMKSVGIKQIQAYESTRGQDG